MENYADRAGGFVNVFSRNAIGFVSRANRFELKCFLRETFP